MANLRVVLGFKANAGVDGERAAGLAQLGRGAAQIGVATLLDRDAVADAQVALLGGDLDGRAVGALDGELVGGVAALQLVAEQAASERTAGAG